MSEAASTSNIVLFESSDGEVRLDVAVDAGKDEIWLNRSQMSLLFGRDVKTIGKHIANALKEELEDSPKPVVAKFATTASDGKSYQVEYYNLDVIISVGYRVKSQRGVEFRRWATDVLRRYIVEGRADDLRIFVEDGEAFLRRSDSGPYDVIINDVFVGREAVPFFASDEGIACARARLTPGGLLMANCVVEYTGDAMYRLFSQVERLRDHFANVYVIDASDDEFGGADNYLLIATDGSYPFTGVIPYGD